MKIGVPVFGYQNFDVFRQHVASRGFFTANLGDNMQSIAIRLLLERIGVPAEDVVSVNRDDLANYSGPPVALIMNGVFLDWSFPPPPQVKPLFVGFNAPEVTIARFRDYFAAHQPIGCRDTATAEVFAKHGIEAYVTGCLTLTIPARNEPPVAGKVLLVYGGAYNTGVGDFPAAALKTMPSSHYDRMEYVFQRLPLASHPLTEQCCLQVERYARDLLDHYSRHASLVITPLHHAATPCMALGIPVVICRNAMDPRFSFLSEITSVYTPPTFDRIDWNPPAVDIEPIRRGLTQLVREKIAAL